MSARGGCCTVPWPERHSPAIARSSELLPQPLGPVLSRASPAARVRERSCTSRRPNCGVCSVSPSRARVSPSRVMIWAPSWGAGTASSLVGGSAQGVGAAGVLSTTCDRACRRSIPATKRLRLSKLSTISDTAASTAAKAPAAWMARPTSSSPLSTSLARMMAGSTSVSWLNPRWYRLSERCFLISLAKLLNTASNRWLSWARSWGSPR